MRKALSTSDLFSSSKQIDEEIKHLHKQIALAEKALASLIKTFTNVSIEGLRLSEKQNELSNSLSFISVEESPSLQKCLKAVSSHTKNVADSTESYASVIQEHVISLMSDCIDECSRSRKNIGDCSAARKNLNKSTRLRKKSKQHESDPMYQKEALQVTRQVQQLENYVEEFEKNRVKNIREWMRVFLHSSLAHHVKAVEEFTRAYQALSIIDIDDHITHLKEKLNPVERNSRLNIVRSNSFNSLNNKGL